jgi:DNA (cytosine-5)-methyltransferase 3A
MVKVLSLFNGMNCIGLALSELGVEFELYASEIDKYANKVSDTLFPNTVNLGDVTKIDLDLLPVFDLVVGGSPCQGFSFAGKQLNFEDERSKLFFDFSKILEACKKKNPNVKFLLENVKMKKEYEAVISRFMGIDPIEINSALLSAQNRVRLYWTNIGTKRTNLFGLEEPGIPQPKDKGILLKDILESEVDEKYFLSDKGMKTVTDQTRLKKKFTAINGDKALCLLSSGTNNLNGTHIKCGAMRGRYKVDGKRQDSKGSIKGKSTQEIEIRKDEKTNCLTSVQKDNILIIPEGTKKGYAEIKDGECVDLTFIDSKTRIGRKMEDKSNCLTAANYDFCQWKDAKIRRLTPKECMRLQTVPEWAIEIMLNCGVSDSQLYKMLGNGWTVSVIAYILGHEYK